MTATERQRRWRAKRKRLARAPNARGDEWYTPPYIIALVRAVLGDIDVDPASCAVAQETVQAKRYHTKADDGLKQQWRGTVFANPPYARGLIDQFATKLVLEYARRHATEAVALVNNQGGTQWFSLLLDVAAAYCFPTGRIPFLDASGRPGTPLVGQAIFYFGPAPERFAEVFAAIGSVTVARPAALAAE